MAHCIVYFSTSVRLFDQEDILNILQQSHQHNAQAGITGILLYMHGHIIQVLEGEEQAVVALFKRIEMDPRHKNVACVLNKAIAERLFAQWRMGYETLTTQQFGQIRTMIDVDQRLEIPAAENEPAILKTLKAFYKINHQG